MTAHDEELRLKIRDLREYLLDCGYAHTSHSGELAGQGEDGTMIHVRTGYTLGSFRILVYGRVNGSKQGLHYTDIGYNVPDQRVREIKMALADWDGKCWPPHPDFRPAPVEQGNGWPPAGRE